MLLGDAGDALDELAVDPRAELHRGAVRAKRDDVAGCRSRAARRPSPTGRPRARAAGTGARAHARPDGRRRAAGSAAAGASRRSARRARRRCGAWRLRRRVRARCTARARAAERARRASTSSSPSKIRAGELLEHDGGVRRELDVEARRELRDPGELVGHRRRDGAAQALHAALEVHRASRRARATRWPGSTRSAQPIASDVEHRDREHRGRPSRRAPARPGRTAASSPETTSSPIDSRSTSSSSAAAAHASATPRAFGVAGRWKAAQPGLPSKPSACAASARRAPPPPPGPDQIEHRALGGAQALAEPRSASATSSCSASAALAGCAWACCRRHRS